MLTDAHVKRAVPRDKPYKLSDRDGMYLHVAPTGTKSWRYDYRDGPRRQTLTLGRFPEIPLKRARELLFEARQRQAEGVNPAADKRRERQAKAHAAVNTFRELGEAWFAAACSDKSASYRKTVSTWLRDDIYPLVGNRPLKEIGPADVLEVMRRFEQRGANHSAERSRSLMSQIFRYGVRSLRADSDPAHAVRGAVKVPKPTHHPAIGLAELPAFLQAVDGYMGAPATKIGMRLLLLTLVRKTELVGARWDEFDLDGAEWRIPAERMKMRTPHFVPLSTQAVALFRELHTLACGSDFVFPGRNDRKKSAGPSLLNDMLAVLGYVGRMTPHGARALASTALNEMGWRSDVIERQLAHTERDKVRAAYHRSEYFDERRQMMQAWADVIDEITRPGSNVRALRRPA